MKNVFITGGARGIGRALAVLFAKSGYRVGISYFSSAEEAEKLRDSFGITALRTDLSAPDGGVMLAKKVMLEFGDVDVLINNAGVSSYGLVQDVTADEYDRVFNTNFKSVLFLTKELICGMIQRKKGTVINVSSVWGESGSSCEVLYSASKAAIIGFTKALAKELAPSGITVNCIAPGVVDTDMMARFSVAEKNLIRDEIPLGRFVDPEEIGEIALMLCSKGGRSVTGQVISVNGGMYC